MFTCKYCKTTNRVAPQNVNIHVHVHGQRPHQPVPMQPMHNPVQVQVNPAAAKASVMISLIVGVLVMLGVGAGVAVPLFMGSGSSGSSVSFGSGLTKAHWDASSGACEIDANGDGVSDVVGLSGGPGDAHTPTILDGNTGKVIWKGTNLGSGAALRCLSSEWFAAGKSDFEIHVYNARKPDPPLKVRGSDKLQKAAMGKGCAALKTSDGSITGVGLPGGAVAPCSAEFGGVFDTPGIIGLTGESTRLYMGDKQYILNKKRAGSGTLSLRVDDKGGKTILSKQLPYISPTFGSGLAVGGNRIVVFGAKPGNKKQGMLIGFEDPSGKELYAVPIQGQVTHSVKSMFHNGRYIILQYWVDLHAFDPNTGKQVW